MGRDSDQDTSRGVDAADRAVSSSVQTIEETLSGSSAFRKIDDGLYVVRQGSAYVMVAVVPLDDHRAIVRFSAQVVTGIKMTGTLARKLLCLNARLRFGAFGYEEETNVVTLSHTILGGETLDPEELLATLQDMALLADDYDDKLVAQGGGSRMQDLLEEEALAHVLADLKRGKRPDPFDGTPRRARKTRSPS